MKVFGDPFVFALCSAIYVICLALIDGLFNRLIFREHRKLHHFSEYKQLIYGLWEWRAVGVILLFLLPIAFPIFIIYTLWGLQYLTTYLIVLFIIPWDMIFGAIVFDDMFADLPSIAIPFYGWFRMPLWKITNVRLFSALMLLIGKLRWGI